MAFVLPQGCTDVAAAQTVPLSGATGAALRAMLVDWLTAYRRKSIQSTRAVRRMSA